jgi:eukaryotic-like serine/threonine-protein kinase
VTPPSLPTATHARLLMHELREHLQESLGSRYVIERELGGGGMSRVFVASETALDRRVVVKVLPPGLTGVNVERFHREILLAARLQHPHIVPLHSAGDMHGTPWYTMPFIDGESLRDRIAREGRLPVPEAIRLLRDVIDALAYAHEHGIIHRDIKPDNIILSRGHALVLDFGVAKALQAANLAHSDDQTSTTAGIAIGTPAYMAPEQAAGDPALDHRSDLYAFGILAYETLAGESPFAGRAPHEMLAASLIERPPLLTELRGDVPASLAELIAYCLEKKPDDRPAGAADVRRALDAVITPADGTVVRRTSAATAAAPVRARTATGLRANRTRWTQRATIAAATLLVLIAAAFAALGGAEERELDDSLVAVMPFRINSPDASLRYLGEGMLDLLAAKLDGNGGPRSADPRSIFSAWSRAGGTVTGELPRDRALSIAENLGAGRMLIGAVTEVSDRLIVTATLIRVSDGRAQMQASVEGSPDSLPQLVDQLTAQLLAAHAGELARLEALTSTSLPALRAYLQGWSLYRRGHFAEAAVEFDRALAEDSTFALAGLGMARSAAWFGDPGVLRRGLAAAHSHRQRLGTGDRALLDAVAGPRYPEPSTAAEIHRARLRLRDIAPDRAESWFELGDSYFHYGHSIGIRDAHERAAEAFRRAIALDSTFGPAMEHLVLLAARAGDSDEARRVGALYLEVDSLSEGALAVQWRVAEATGDSARIRELLEGRARASAQSAYTIAMISQLDGLNMEVAEAFARARLDRAATPSERQAHLTTLHDLALNRGRPDEALALNAEMARDEPTPRQHLRDRIRAAIFWEGDSAAAAAAVRQLERGLREPRPAERTQRVARVGDLCTLELWRLAHGDSSRVQQSLRALRDPELAGDIAFAGQCGLILEAMHLAPRRDAASAAAINRLHSLLASGPGGFVQDAGNLIVARLKEAQGDISGAREALHRREYFLSRTMFLSSYLRDEARLAEMAGDHAAAAEARRHLGALRERSRVENEAARMRPRVR